MNQKILVLALHRPAHGYLSRLSKPNREVSIDPNPSNQPHLGKDLIMKLKLLQILMICFVAIAAQADTSLSVSNAILFGFTTELVNSTFTLPGVSGTGSLASLLSNNPQIFPLPYNYVLDLSGMPSATNHCIKLVVHFGHPTLVSSSEVLVLTNNHPAYVSPTSATLSPGGDITFVFGQGCLQPGQTATEFAMFSESPAVTNTVTIIDDYVNPESGMTNESRVTVPALVPDIPPNWIIAAPFLANPVFQGVIQNNNSTAAANGQYTMSFQLLSAPSNGLPVSELYTQAVQVANGLFTTSLPFDPNNFYGGPTWLSIGVKAAAESGPIQLLAQPLPVSPAPQAFYAYSAGVVASLSPGQAVTSFNGLTDAVQLQPGAGILLGMNGNTLTISAAIGSDRNLKKDFAPVDPRTVLDQLTALPVQRWRYLNEDERIRHLGPMAQDFKAAFGLGSDDKSIGLVDASGVALAAIQGLNEKVETGKQQAETRIEKLEALNAELKQQNEALEKRLDDLEQMIKSNSGEDQ
jgi:hypothetical protein